MPSRLSTRFRTALRPETDRNALKPDAVGTGLLLASIALAWLLVDGEGTAKALRMQAIFLGIGLASSLALDFRYGFRNLMRVDVMALLAFYFLTFVEFLFPQPGFDILNQMYNIGHAAQATLLGMAGLAVGRHAATGAKRAATSPRTAAGLSAGQWLALLWIAAGLGYLHMLLAVKFNPIAWIDAIMQPRFNQPWSRGKFGDWKALINELNLFIYAIPPVYGILLAHRRKISAIAMAAASALVIFTLFQSFAGGTRNIFLIYVAGLSGAYLLASRNLSWTRVLVVASASVVLIYLGTTQMLAFRQIGLREYLKGNSSLVTEEQHSSFAVDYNLVSMARIMDAFPARYDFLGFEVPYQAIIRPIPRAVWPGKPEGLSVSIEEASEMGGLTLAVTFAGEAYMAGGIPAVLITALIIGLFCGLWNHRFRGSFDSFSTLMYASGFFPAAITMRSLFSLTTAILPTLGLLVVAWLLKQHSPRRAGSRSPAVKPNGRAEVSKR